MMTTLIIVDLNTSMKLNCNSVMNSIELEQDESLMNSELLEASGEDDFATSAIAESWFNEVN